MPFFCHRGKLFFTVIPQCFICPPCPEPFPADYRVLSSSLTRAIKFNYESKFHCKHETGHPGSEATPIRNPKLTDNFEVLPLRQPIATLSFILMGCFQDGACLSTCNTRKTSMAAKGRSGDPEKDSWMKERKEHRGAISLRIHKHGDIAEDVLHHRKVDSVRLLYTNCFPHLSTLYSGICSQII